MNPAAEASAWMDQHHPGWEEYAEELTRLAARLYAAGMQKVTDRKACVDELYHIVSNAPGCARV